MIETRGITVRFGDVEAISCIDFSVRRGELVGVVGGAAAGKTVLLKALCLLVPVTEGRVLLEGQDLTAGPADRIARERSRIGFCFQNLALFDQVDVAENVAFPLVRRGVSHAEARVRAEAQLKAVGLGAATTKYPHELSGGMKRRLALARAMVARPEIAIFDDPFVGLDPVACARIARLVAAAHAEAGGVTVVAAGDPAPLFDVVDRLVLMEGGRIVADLPPSRFTPQAGPAVARYLGPGDVAA